MAISGFGRKITSTRNTLSQKAKNLSEVSSLRGQINTEQNKMENYFLNLGKLYYEHADEYQLSELSELVNLISESENKINHLNQRISEIENAKLCPNCGVQIEEGTTFCTNCGVKIEGYSADNKKEADLDVRRCKSCGAEIPGYATFCNKCGARQ